MGRNLILSFCFCMVLLLSNLLIINGKKALRGDISKKNRRNLGAVPVEQAFSDAKTMDGDPIEVEYPELELIDSVAETNSDIVYKNEPLSRVGIIIVHANNTWPAWFPMYLTSLQFSSSLYDYIFVTLNEIEVPEMQLPANAKMIKFSIEEISKRLFLLDNKYNTIEDVGKDSRLPNMLSAMNHLITTESKLFNDFKPCYGHIFSDILKEYSHWGYSSLDMLVGKLDKIVSPDILNAYDVVTISYGDPFMYMRSEFTILRNRIDLNSIWKKCSQYTHIFERMLFYMGNTWFTWQFQNPDGCFSSAINSYPNIKLLVSTSALSDAQPGNVKMKEAMFLGKSLLQCYQHPVDSNDKALIKSFESISNYPVGKGPIFGSSDARFVRFNKSPLCVSRPSFDLKYELCFDHLPSRVDMIRWNGSLWHVRDTRRESFKGDCWESSIYHFPNWQNKYHAHLTPVPPLDSHVVLITDEGFIPFRLPHDELKEVNYQSLLSNRETVSFGRLKPGSTNIASDYPYKSTSHCLDFSKNQLICLCPLKSSSIQINKSSKESSLATSPTAVTLISIGMELDFDDKFIHELKLWDGPKIVVLGYLGSTSSAQSAVDKAISEFESLTVVRVSIDCPPVKDYSRASGLIPDNTLLNIGLELLNTKLVLIKPPGFHLHAHDLKQSLHDAFSNAIKQNFALVVPSFHHDKKTSEQDSLTPYPGRKVWYGQNQPEAFQIEFEAFKKITSPILVDSHSGWSLLLPLSVMLPIAFDTSVSPHGTGFVRFPEELNGYGCYGCTIFRVLSGAGYALTWMPQVYAINKQHREQGDSSNTHSFHYGCINADRFVNGTRTMLVRANRYYQRAEELRNTGISGIYSTLTYQENMQIPPEEID